MSDSFITRPGALWLLLAATLSLTVAFPLAAGHWGLTLLDGVSSPDEARALIREMTPAQRVAHAWITATLDAAYPLAYGGLFAGSALRVFGFGPWGRLAAVPALVAVLADFGEGIAQVLALAGAADWLALKAVATPLKTVMFILGGGITLAAWATWARRRLAVSMSAGTRHRHI